MSFKIIDTEDQYVFNHAAKHLARENQEQRHLYTGAASDQAGRIAEAWRFPVIDGHREDTDESASPTFNRVTFIYRQADPLPHDVAVIGSFANLYEPLPLRRVGDSAYFALGIRIPRGEVHTYRFLVNGEPQPDSVNPQRLTLDNGQIWSRFFTQGCTIPLVLERWERRLLERLCAHILPFRTKEAENFLERFHDFLDTQARTAEYPQAYRFDESIGVVNFIDKLLAREESHHQIDYRICLEEIDRVLRQRNPVMEPARMPTALYQELYDEMGANAVNGWDYARYNSPRYFLQLLRRHTMTGAFAHPKYGGNAGAAAWAWLGERYRDETGNTLFDWGRSQELPLGRDPFYRG